MLADLGKLFNSCSKVRKNKEGRTLNLVFTMGKESPLGEATPLGLGEGSPSRRGQLKFMSI